MNIVPLFGNSGSYWDEMDDLFWGHPLQRSRQQRVSPRRQWHASVKLHGFMKEEIKWQLSDDNAKIVVNARHEIGDDFSMIRRTVDVPDTVNTDTMQSDVTRDGTLVFVADFKQQTLDQSGGILQPWGRALSQEMRDLQNQVKQVCHQTPSSMQSTYVKDDNGQHFLHLDFNMRDYKPEEVSVKHDEKSGVISVEAKHEQDTELGHSYKHFKREFKLPENVKVNAMTSKMLPNDGLLRLEVPCDLKEKADECEHAVIPIQRK